MQCDQGDLNVAPPTIPVIMPDATRQPYGANGSRQRTNGNGINGTAMHRRDEISPPTKPVVFESATMQDILRQIERIAKSDITTLIVGETGTGKEIIADEL